jgi:hypothetical protein
MSGAALRAKKSVGRDLLLVTVLCFASLADDTAFSEAAHDNADVVSAFYPPEALAKGVAGEASLDCDVDAHFRLIKCKVLSEKPEGYGFGEAALKVAASIPGNPRVTVERKWQRVGGPQVFRFTPNPPSISPPPLQPPHIVTNPDFLIPPDGRYLAEKYPELVSGPPGLVTLECVVTVDGRLDQCTVVEETPKGRGLSVAALDWAAQQQMKPRTVDGVPQGGARIRKSLRFGRP